MKKKYVREPKNEVDTFLTRVNKTKLQPELFTDVFDIDGNIVDPAKITRATEMTGAGVEYLTSFVDFICTHFKKDVDKSNALYYSSPEFDWAAAIDIMTGGITGQRERAEIAIMHYVAKPKQALVLCADGHYRSAQPFVLQFDWGRKEDLDAKAAARLARLNISKGNKPEKDDGTPRLPIIKVTVMFYKPLFEDFFKRGASTYSFPVGMYAKFLKEANELKKNLTKRKKEHNITDEMLNLDKNTFISAYTRFARYIIRHNNLTAKQLKDKNHYSPISFDLLKTIDFLSQVYSSAISTNGRGENHVDMPKFREFLANSIALYRIIPDFILYPTLEHIDRNGFRLGIYTSMEAADKADSKKQR